MSQIGVKTNKSDADGASNAIEERMRLIIDTIPTMAWSVRPDGAVDFVNKRWLEYTGLSFEEELKEPTRAIHPEDLPSVMEKWLADMAAEEPSEDEMRLRRADGQYRWFLVRTAPLRDERGNLVKWYGVSIDIEDRKRVEVQSRALIDAIPQQIWSGPADGTLDYCNERWRSYMGLGLAELRGDGWQRMLHPDDRKRVLKAWHESVTNGTPYEQEERHRGAEGPYRWFLARGVPLRDSEGHIVRWYGTNTDIEDRKVAEGRLRLVIDTLPALVWRKLPDGSADFLNQRFREYTGLSVEEGLGWGWMMKGFHPEDRAEEEWRAAFAAGQPFEKEARMRRADGEYRWFLHRAVPLYDELGNVVKWYGTTTDIEERKRTEAELQERRDKLAHVTRTQAMGELAAAIAHEVNQPLT